MEPRLLSRGDQPAVLEEVDCHLASMEPRLLSRGDDCAEFATWGFYQLQWSRGF